MIRAISSILLVFVATSAAAQSDYFAPGSLGEDKGNQRDRVMAAYQEARWRLGPIELQPHLSVGNLSYVSNVYSTAEGEAISDLRGGAAAGLRAFFNLGPKIVVSPFANLGYTWWREQEELRTLSESFGVQVFGDFNRLQLQLRAGSVESQRNLSSELEVPVNPRVDLAGLDLEVDIRGPLRLFATATHSENRYSGKAAEREVPGLGLSFIETDSERLTAGLGYELGNGLFVGLGYLSTETDYLDDPSGRSQSGSGPLLRVDLDATRLSIRVDLAQIDVEFRARGGLADRRQTDGRATLGWKFGQRLSSTVYRGVQLNASALDNGAIFESNRTGVSLGYKAGQRGRAGLFFEIGEDEFATAASDQVTRTDDLTSYGASYRLEVTPRWSLELGYLDSRRDSSDPALDRDLSSLSFRLSLGGNLLPWQP